MSACMYVMILNGKLHTSKHQKQVSNRIFHKEERERKLHNVQFFGRIQWIPPVKIVTPARESYVSLCRADCCHDLSIEILNILYDRHDPNPGLLILRTFEHLNSNT